MDHLPGDGRGCGERGSAVFEAYRFALQDAAFSVNRSRGVRTNLLAHLGSEIPHLPGHCSTPQQKFGTRAVEVLELARIDRQLAAPIVAGAPGIQAEIVYSIRYEMATSIEDVLARRIGLQWFSWNSAIAAAPLVGSYLAQEHGWSAAQTQQAVRDYALQTPRTMCTGGPRARACVGRLRR